MLNNLKKLNRKPTSLGLRRPIPDRGILVLLAAVLLMSATVTCADFVLVSKDHERSAKRLESDRLKDAFNKIARLSKSAIHLQDFVDQVEKAVAPYKLDEWTGGVDFGVGEFRIGSKTNPSLRLQLTARSSKNNAGEEILVLVSAKVQVRRLTISGKWQYENVSSEWADGKIIDKK